MAGPLLPADVSLGWFTWPLAASFFALALTNRARLFPALLKLAIPCCSIITLAVAHVPTSSLPMLLSLLGIAAAPVSIFTGMLLRQSDHPLLNAAIGLALGNLGVALLAQLPLPSDAWLALLAGSLTALLLAPRAAPDSLQGDTPGLGHILPFVLCFQLVSGLMYARMLPDYAISTASPAIQLMVYAVAALLLVGVLQKWRMIAAPFGVMAASLAYIVWALHPSAVGAVSATLLMMLAAAAIDLFVLSRVLDYRNQLRAYGLGIGTLVLGIAVGSSLSQLVEPLANPSAIVLALLALGALNLSMLTLLPWRRNTQAQATPAAAGQTAATPPGQPDCPVIPGTLRDKLSAQENQVLDILLTEHTYKEIAAQMGISESSVKTYAQRIFRKLGVVRRGQLTEHLTRLTAKPGTEHKPEG